MLLKPLKQLRALSLVEVLVVLGLVSVSMVGVAAINVRSLVAVKDNELLDTANGVMLQALELAKSPTPLSINDPTNSPTLDGKFAIDPNDSTRLIKRPSTDANLSATSTCNSNSPYYIRIADDTNPPDICLQLTFVRRQRPLITDTYYEVTARVLFKMSKGPILNQLVAYRRADDT